MVGYRTDNRPNYKMDKEQMTVWPSKTTMDRVHKDLIVLGVLNGEVLVTERDRWRGLVAAAKDLNGFLLRQKIKKTDMSNEVILKHYLGFFF